MTKDEKLLLIERFRKEDLVPDDLSLNISAGFSEITKVAILLFNTCCPDLCAVIIEEICTYFGILKTDLARKIFKRMVAPDGITIEEIVNHIIDSIEELVLADVEVN